MSSRAAGTEPGEPGVAAEFAPDGAAFFDVDNTMMIGASIFHFAKGMAARDLFSWRDLIALHRAPGKAPAVR